MLIRVILDTCTVRNHVHKTGPRLNLQAIRAYPDQLRLSLPGSTFAELLEQLCDNEGGIAFPDWQNAVPDLDSILDKRWPFLPSGKQLSALTGLQTDLTLDVAFERSYMQACWQLLKSATNVADFQRGLVFQGPDSQRCEIKLDPKTLETVNAGERQSWIDHIEKMQKLLSSLRVGTNDEEKVYNMMRSNQGTQPLDPPGMAEKLDSVNRMIAKLVALSLQRKAAYNPKTEKRRGDAFDISLLFYVPLPAVICTADQKLVRRLRDTGASHSQQVVNVDEFNQHVVNGTLSSLVSSFKTADVQLREWQEAAYFQWISRDRPIGEDWVDWFASEPVA
jgi:hypothetical protein